MKVNIKLDFNINIEDSKFDTIIQLVKKILCEIISTIVHQIIVYFAEIEMKKDVKSFKCQCGNDHNFVFATKKNMARRTKINSFFGQLEIPLIIVRCKECRKQIYLNRFMLGIDKKKQYTSTTKKFLASIGSFSTFRVAEKTLKSIGLLKKSKMTIWRSVQEVANTINFEVDKNEFMTGQVDGTGIPIRNTGIRGEELKLLMQNTKEGGMRIASVSIDKYKKWKEIAGVINENKIDVVCDGDRTLTNNLSVNYSLCLWHIPHLVKYELWRGGIRKTNHLYAEIMRKIFDLCKIDKSKMKRELYINKKIELNNFIYEYKNNKSLKSLMRYFKLYRNHLFEFLKHKNLDMTNSKIERAMRIVNDRINVGGCWSRKGALAAIKIRLAHYYNGWNP